MTAGERIERALRAAGMSQRSLAESTGLSQASLSRVIAGHRVPKLPELVAIAAATGHTPAQLSGESTVEERVQCAARATGASGMEQMREQLLGYLELDAYLDDQGIASVP